MSSCSRRALLAAALLPLAACGFEPALGTAGKAQPLVDQIAVEAPKDSLDFAFAERIEERIGRGGTAFALSYDIDVETRGAAITPQNNTTRFDVFGKVRYKLTDSATDKVVKSGTAQSFTGYSSAGTPVSDASQEADANERLMRILADQVISQLMASAAAKPVP